MSSIRNTETSTCPSRDPVNDLTKSPSVRTPPRSRSEMPAVRIAAIVINLLRRRLVAASLTK
jgi:hypothetical protein